MLISEKSRMVTYLFLSCYANDIPLSSSYKKIREFLGTDYFSHMLDQASLIDCDSAKIVERDRYNQAMGIKEAVYIRILPNMNNDEGRHRPSCMTTSLGPLPAPEGWGGEHTIFMSECNS